MGAAEATIALHMASKTVWKESIVRTDWGLINSVQRGLCVKRMNKDACDKESCEVVVTLASATLRILKMEGMLTEGAKEGTRACLAATSRGK